MKSINLQNKSNSTEYRSVSFDGFTIAVDAVGNVVTFTSAPVALEKLQLTGTLYRGSEKPKVIFDTNARNLVAFSEFYYPGFEYMKATSGVVLQSGSGTCRHIFPFKFKLPSIINLSKDDRFVIDWSLNDGFFSTQVNTGSSSIELEINEAIGLEYSTPFIKVIGWEGAQESATPYLGDNVTKIGVFNYDKSSVLIADRVILSCKLESDKYGYTDNYTELLTKRAQMFQDETNSNLRYQSFMLFDSIHHGGVELDGVRLNLSGQQSNIAAGQNVFIYSYFESSDEIVTKAVLKKDKHDLKVISKGKFNPGLVKR